MQEICRKDVSKSPYMFLAYSYVYVTLDHWKYKMRGLCKKYVRTMQVQICEWMSLNYILYITYSTISLHMIFIYLYIVVAYAIQWYMYKTYINITQWFQTLPVLIEMLLTLILLHHFHGLISVFCLILPKLQTSSVFWNSS